MMNGGPLAPVPEMEAEELPGHLEAPASTAASETASAAPALPEALTAREKDVLRYLVEGLTDPEIAEALVISPRTVHAHLRNIYGKLGVNSRTAATRLVLEGDLI
jgi:DNA-binding NarL/FixJ family response regulator